MEEAACGAGLQDLSAATTSRAERVLEYDSETQTARTLSGKASPAPPSEADPWQDKSGDPWSMIS